MKREDPSGSTGFFVAAVVGGASAFGATLVSGLVVESGLGAGTVSYEMGFLWALILSSLVGPFAGLLGAALGKASRRIPGAWGWCGGVLASAATGAGAMAAFYLTVIAPRATVPHRHVVWVGVIAVIGVAAGGATCAIIARSSRRGPQ